MTNLHNDVDTTKLTTRAFTAFLASRFQQLTEGTMGVTPTHTDFRIQHVASCDGPTRGVCFVQIAHVPSGAETAIVWSHKDGLVLDFAPQPTLHPGGDMERIDEPYAFSCSTEPLKVLDIHDPDEIAARTLATARTS